MKAVIGNQPQRGTEAMLKRPSGIRTNLPNNVLRAFAWLGSRIRYHQRHGNSTKVDSLRLTCAALKAHASDCRRNGTIMLLDRDCAKLLDHRDN